MQSDSCPEYSQLRGPTSRHCSASVSAADAVVIEAEGGSQLRVIVDTATLRRRRVGGGLLFRPANVALQRWWYEAGMRRAARRCGADVMLMPGAYACRRGPIPQLVAILDVNYLTQPGTHDAAFVR